MATISEALAIAIQHHQAGRLQAAEQIYRQILAVEPNHADALHLLGVASYQLGEYEAGIECMRRAIALMPNRADAHDNLGKALRERGRLAEAVACCQRALELKPDYAEAHNNLGAAFQEQGKLDEAVACYRRALQLKPDYAKAHNNLGIAFTDQGKLDEAIACYRRALQLKPDYDEAHNNLGAAFHNQGKLDEAIACYRRALQLKPDYAEAHKNCGHAWLLAGDWQRGWPEYQWRWQTRNFPPRPFSQPLWNGEPLAGKTILLHAEQGLGDTIQFIRYASIVKQHGGTVIVECQKLLLGLLEGCPGVDRLAAQGDALPAFDVHAPLLSVPGILNTSPETVPARIPYLLAKPALLEPWRTRLIEFGGLKIGIAWRGSPEHRKDRARSIPLSCFEPLASLPAIHLVSLQKGAGAEELQEVRDHFPVTDLGGRLQDFMDTAAVLANLDLVTTCDTAVAHLAGALGVPVWVALPFVPDWRWLLDRSDTPWYPTMRLFRQKKPGDWAGVFEEIKTALSSRLQARE